MAERAEIQITLPDGATRSFPRGARLSDVVSSIGPRLAREAIACLVDGEVLDLGRSLESDASVRVLTSKDPEALDVLRHSTAHLTAHAVKDLFPEVQIGIGPVTDGGYYYDFLRQDPFTPEDLEKIEHRMEEIARADFPIERIEQPKSQALEIFRGQDDELKVELVEEKGGPVVSCYRQDGFIDFCLGPHVPSTGRIKAFKLLSVAGAYWKGDASNAQLQRIYGTSFFSRKDLDAFMERRAEAEKRDHRKLGKALDLFSFHPESPASPFFHPKGAIIYNQLVEHVREGYFRNGYQEVITPQVFDLSLFEQSGHLANYRDNMYMVRGGEREFGLKPMNCPSHTVIYRTQRRSYRDLPIRLADFGRLHRLELSGVTAGLTRVRSFSQDDAHIFCTEDQILDEVRGVTGQILELYRLFGFGTVRIYLSTKPEKAQGSEEIWRKAEAALARALDEQEIAYKVNAGDGAFYGPKIDFVVTDALEREHQLGTIQLDFSMPERFHLRYAGADGTDHQPVMIHRAMLGSLERFMGILIEHLAGAMPVWLAPVQVAVLPVTDRALDWAREVAGLLSEGGFRAFVDERGEKIGAKIRESQLQKIPYMLVVGDREAEARTVSVRVRSRGDEGAVPVEAFLATLGEQVRSKSLTP
ncbi:MAG TPA: threonine--tRNA ligase [Candidatus Saccharimonadales bacterium]|nr:threonine--tRNA ligase [Candidatus Saccharimonadales bacterium]